MTDLTKSLKDALYVAVGLGVLGFQRAQVRRVELTKQLDASRGQLDTQLTEARTQIVKVARTLEERLDEIEDKLPPQAKELVKQARLVAREAQDQLRGRFESAA